MGAAAVPVEAELMVRGWASPGSDGVGKSGERGAGYPMSGRGRSGNGLEKRPVGAVAVPVSAETIVRGLAWLDSDGVVESGERGAGYPMAGRGSDETGAAGRRSGGPWRKAIGEAAP